MKKVSRNEIIEEIKQGKIVVLPTDTVYGLMAKVNQENEYLLNEFKLSDRNKKISIIFPDIDTLLTKIDTLNEERIQMIKDKLPGKYTFIVNLKKDYCENLGFNRTDFGVRVTSDNELQSILKETGEVLATSCNYSKEDICVTEEDITRIFNGKDISYYFTSDGTSTPSTIIDLTKENINVIR